MQTRFVPAKPGSSNQALAFFGSALEVERTIWYLRWVVLLGGLALAWVADVVVLPGLLLVVAAVGGAINLGLGHLLRSMRRFPPWLAHATVLLDILLLSGFVSALEGPANRYSPVYLLPVATAAMRFGFVGTVVTAALAWVGLASVFWVTYGLPDHFCRQVAYPTLLLWLASFLLGRFARRIRDWVGEGLRREQHLERRLTELVLLQEFNRAVYDLRSGDTLQNIVEVCTKVLNFRRAALFLSTEQKGMPDRYCSSRRIASSRELPPLHFDLTLFKAMMQADRPLVVDGSQGSDMMAHKPLVEVAAPLRTPNGPIGVLVVDCDDRERVSRTEIGLLDALARTATLAIENARVHSQVQWQASHDGLTGLYNHGHFQEALRRRVGQSDAEGHPLALFMIELDNFKFVNDTYGHRQGDRVLIVLARALEAYVEQWRGMVARYGGDEFTVVLPDQGCSEALEAAQNVCHWVRTFTAEELSRHNLPSITVSIGVAVYPADAQSASQLIYAADQAMYAAKRQGGDRAETFSRIESSSPLPSHPVTVGRGSSEKH
ncbi:MAG: sensor domain-containing diguanylate cyclase [Anaerolineae bacterium]|nr:MAG: sensor domain-containing diguanylate cyclase [Anaerolineae bacterium]